MKKTGIARIFTVCALGVALFSCATGSGIPAVEGLVGLDEAVAAAVQAVEARVEDGAGIAVYKIVAENNELGEYLAEDLSGAFSASGKLKPLAREKALAYVDTEHEFQMSGLVDDESAVGVGHYLGAQVVATGTFSRYAGFSQLWLRAVDVRTSEILAQHKGRVENKDPVLANITAPLGNAPCPP